MQNNKTAATPQDLGYLWNQERNGTESIGARAS